jgi:hypothetical protein
MNALGVLVVLGVWAAYTVAHALKQSNNNSKGDKK